MSSKQPESFVLYLDESIDSATLAEALAGSGTDVRRALDNFPRGTPDEVWLASVGEKGWVVLTRDRRIRYRQLEKLALQEAGLKAFVFTGGNATVAQTTAIVLKALPKMKTLCVSQPGPFIYHIGLGGVPIKVS